MGKIDNSSNYQCKFLSGEANAQKAIDILESKFDWVGLTEDYKAGIKSFKNHFDVKDLYVEEKVSNKSLTDTSEKQKIAETYKDFIYSQNIEDWKLYEYVKNNIWPRFKDHSAEEVDVKSIKSNPILRKYKLIEFQIDRQLSFNETNINSKNIKIFYNRWIK